MGNWIDEVYKLGEEISGLIYGVQWNQNTDEWTRIDEFGNPLKVTQADFDRHPLWGGMRRCTLADDGSVNHYGSNPRGDGLTLDGTEGQAMVEMKKMFVKSRSPSANVYQWWVSPAPRVCFEVHPAWLMRGGIERDNIYFGAYEAHHDGVSKLESITGATVDNNKTIATFRTNAEARGPRWGITNIWSLNAVQLLYYIEYANANSQTQIGRGIVDAGAGSNTGADSMDSSPQMGVNGTGSGSGTDGLTPIAYRGIENLWGNYWTFVDGYLALDTEYRIIRRDGRGIFRDALAYGDYERSVAVPITSDGYISNIHYEDLLKYLFIASATAGSSTTYLCDQWQGHDDTPPEVNILVSEGGWAEGDAVGVATRHSHNVAATAATTVGGRIEFI